MAEEFELGCVCGGNLWKSLRNLFSSSTYSSAINETGGFGWWSSHIGMKTTSHDTEPSEGNYSQIVQASGALNPSMKYRHETNDNWNPKINTLCEDFSVDTSNFPMNSASYGHTSSSLLRTLFDADSDHPQQALFYDQEMNYISRPSKAYPMGIKPFVAKQQPENRLQFSDITPFRNATARPDFIPSTPSQYLTSGLNNFPSTSDQKKKMDKFERPKDESKNLASSAKKSSGNGPAVKPPRLKTPSPLPTFKVRKEKLGDRVTTLHQLVSPFGKADTASVLLESIEYIKFLHAQVNVLTTPYLTNGSPPFQWQQDQKEDLKRDLSSRGLCLVPISSTFSVAAENTSDF